MRVEKVDAGVPGAAETRRLRRGQGPTSWKRWPQYELSLRKVVPEVC